MLPPRCATVMPAMLLTAASMTATMRDEDAVRDPPTRRPGRGTGAGAPWPAGTAGACAGRAGTAVRSDRARTAGTVRRCPAPGTRGGVDVAGPRTGGGAPLSCRWSACRCSRASERCPSGSRPSGCRPPESWPPDRASDAASRQVHPAAAERARQWTTPRTSSTPTPDLTRTQRPCVAEVPGSARRPATTAAPASARPHRLLKPGARTRDLTQRQLCPVACRLLRAELPAIPSSTGPLPRTGRGPE